MAVVALEHLVFVDETGTTTAMVMLESDAEDVLKQFVGQPRGRLFEPARDS
jgi:hypothetical protein